MTDTAIYSEADIDRWEWKLAARRPPLDDPCDLLDDYLPTVLQLRVPDWPLCEHHQTPSDFVRDAVATKDGRSVYPIIVCVANRGGAKSFNCSLVEWLKVRRYDGFQASILGGSGQQSAKCYEHSRSFWDGLSGKLAADLKREPTEHKTSLRNGSGMTILMASHTSVRGGRVNDLVTDEADEIKREIFEASMGQAIKPWSEGGIQRIVASTINRAGGIIEDLISRAPQGKIHLITYCWKEVTRTCDTDWLCAECELYQSCRGDLRALHECIVIAVDEDTSEVRVAREHAGRTYETTIWTDQIEDCPAELAPGDRVEVRGNPHGFLDVRDVLEYKQMVSDETWDSEMDCNLKQPLGAVLKRADVDRCTKTLRYSDTPPYAFDRSSKLETWLGVDWGYRNETCVVVYQWDGKLDLRVIAEMHWTEKTGDELAKLIKDIGDRYKTNHGYADAEDPDKIKACRKRGITLKAVAFGAWKDRCLEAMRVWLQGRGQRNLSINANCTHLTNALIQWRYKDEVVDESAERAIVKKDDHPCDAMLAGFRRFAKKQGPRMPVPEQTDERARYRTMAEAAG